MVQNSLHYIMKEGEWLGPLAVVIKEHQKTGKLFLKRGFPGLFSAGPIA